MNIDINSVLLTILQAIIIATVPILAKCIIDTSKGLIDNARENTRSQLVKGYLEEIQKAVETAVQFTSQTYVDALKKGGEFNIEEQKKAFEKCMSEVLRSLQPETKNFIITSYGSLVDFISPKIEAAVRKQKTETEQPNVM